MSRTTQTTTNRLRRRSVDSVLINILEEEKKPLLQRHMEFSGYHSMNDSKETNWENQSIYWVADGKQVAVIPLSKLKKLVPLLESQLTVRSWDGLRNFCCIELVPLFLGLGALSNGTKLTKTWF